MNEVNKNLGKITHTISEHGAPVIEQLLDKLTGKGAQVKYSFENLNIEMPSATKPDGQTVKGGRFNVRGAITISAKVIEASKASSDFSSSSPSDYKTGSSSNTLETKIGENSYGQNNANQSRDSDESLKSYNSTENSSL